MAAILRRLQAAGMKFPEAYDGGNHLSNLPQKIDAMDIVVLRQLVQAHIDLNLEYSVQCARLAHEFVDKEEGILIQEIESALFIAQLLEHVYQHRLNVPREVARLRQDQEVFRKLLVSLGRELIPQDHPEIPKVPRSSKDVRDFMVNGNWPRFFIIRSRRLLVSMIPFFDEFSQYTRFIRSIDQYLAPALSYLAWLYFIPRMTINLFLLGKHGIPGGWMSPEEKAIGWQCRVKAHVMRKLFEHANDTVWFGGGWINCFMLAGNPYFSVVLQAYDVFLACMRTLVEMGRLNRIKQDYEEMLKKPGISQGERNDIEKHLEFLKQRMEYEQKRMALGIINNAILLLAMCAALPALAFHPIVPFCAAIVILTNTIAAYKYTKYLEHNKPLDKVTDLKRTVEPQPSPLPTSSVANQGMFKPPRLSRSDHRTDFEQRSSSSP